MFKFYFNHELLFAGSFDDCTIWSFEKHLNNNDFIGACRDYLRSLGCSEWVDEVDNEELLSWFLTECGYEMQESEVMDDTFLICDFGLEIWTE